MVYEKSIPWVISTIYEGKHVINIGTPMVGGLDVIFIERFVSFLFLSINELDKIHIQPQTMGYPFYHILKDISTFSEDNWIFFLKIT